MTSSTISVARSDRRVLGLRRGRRRLDVTPPRSTALPHRPERRRQDDLHRRHHGAVEGHRVGEGRRAGAARRGLTRSSGSGSAARSRPRASSTSSRCCRTSTSPPDATAHWPRLPRPAWRARRSCRRWRRRARRRTRHAGRHPVARPEAVAGDRDAARAGREGAAARRARRRHEPRRAHRDRRAPAARRGEAHRLWSSTTWTSCAASPRA